MAARRDRHAPDRGVYAWTPVLLAGLVAASILGAATFHLRRHGVGTLDNDAYSYIAEWQWIRSQGLFGAPRSPTGNLPKPLLVVLYGLLYEAGHEAAGINL